MGTRKKLAGIVLLALLVAGCAAGTREPGRVEAKFQKIDFDFSTLENVNSAYNDKQFESETQKYIVLVRTYANQLGRTEARRRLMGKADELSSYCLPCEAKLTAEATRY
jgi:PBP1b-binding outer membrane lipoprotein LpoB